MEQLIILLVVGLIALAKWAIQKATQGGEDTLPPPSAGRTIPRQTMRTDPETSGEAERMRKFMEALGIPPGSAPPQPRRRTVVRRSPSNPLGIPEAPGQPVKTEITSYGQRPELPPPIPTAVPPSSPVVLTISVPPGATEVRAILPPREPELPQTRELVETSPAAEISGTADLRALLRSPESIRAAIIAREILGSPRGLQSPF